MDDPRRLDEKLLSPGTRRDETWQERVLDPSFVEVGASGRVYDRARRRRGADGRGGPAGTFVIDGWTERVLSSHLPLARYRITVEGPAGTRTSERKSIWRRADDGWRILFHQGTSVPRP